ncbi:DUF4012 domain-containing protein [Nocardioides sp. CFH 31398]|uniref:DUF4012 domain-containing protein n=1 Tax=Nocardioides sp. CFH 31398 TaxID=2919579 RepID=UPI001F067C98|nr:DUF4012 domain-containing protein [Nocardioides sp. CFH 31398]MCH1866004.1 DUF4012 domain-containing protein [Nocardioides sp. CFH 31398]
MVAAALAWFGWVGYQTYGDLTDAQSEASRLTSSLSSGDAAGAREAGRALERSARSAMDRTDGWDWAALTVVPGVGDDAAGLRALSSSLHTLAADAVLPLADATGDLDGLAGDGGVDLGVVEELGAPVGQGYAATRDAAEQVQAVDSSGFVGRLREPYDQYVDTVTGLESGLGAADVATDLLPTLAGGEGPRNVLVLIQNNAEIRATGGLPGAFVLLRADEGRIEITRQGGPRDFEGDLDAPILPLTDAEDAIFSENLGTFFQDANFTPDFPRTAELVNAHWESSGSPDQLDAVMSIDPVALSYLLPALGPVEVDGVTLTQDNLLEELLSRPYLELEPEAQDALFEQSARAILETAVTDLTSPVDFLRGAARAGREGRFLLHSFDDAEQERLTDTRVAGELTGDDGATPHLDVALNDATGSKMSYYLRYGVEVDSEGCRDGVQILTGSMRLRSTIESEAAAELPVSVTGGGLYGTEPGSQLVSLTVIGPYGGTIERLRVDRELVPSATIPFNGRPVVIAGALLDSTTPVDVDWQMTTAPGETGGVQVGVTPSIVPGNKNFTSRSAC